MAEAGVLLGTTVKMVGQPRLHLIVTILTWQHLVVVEVCLARPWVWVGLVELVILVVEVGVDRVVEAPVELGIWCREMMGRHLVVMVHHRVELDVAELMSVEVVEVVVLVVGGVVTLVELAQRGFCRGLEVEVERRRERHLFGRVVREPLALSCLRQLFAK